MVRKLVAGLFTVAVFATTVFAQSYPSNARIDALGGAFIVSDPSGILAYSAQMNNYADNAQVTFNSPIWGIKSLGKVVNLGVVFNRPLLLSVPMDTNFYAYSDVLAGTVGSSANVGQNVPHVLLGLNLSAVKLGFDFFYENGHYRNNLNDEPTGATATKRKVEISGNIRNAGCIASGILDMSGISLSLKAGLGLSGMNAKNSTATTPVATGVTTTVTTEVSSKSGTYVVGGAEVGLKIKDANVTIGAEVNRNAFQFKQVNGNLDRKYAYTDVTAYAGFTAPVTTSSFAVLQYTFDFNSTGNEADSLTYAIRKFNTNYLINIFSAGFENTWDKTNIFDKITARAGLNYVIYSQVDHVKGDGTAGKYSSRVKQETVYGQVDPRVGLGFTKSVFAFDVNVNPTVWAGLISGPSVAKVTVSLDF